VALQAGGFNVLLRRQAEHVAQRGLRRQRRDTRARDIGIWCHCAHRIAAAEGAREGLPQRARRQHAAVAERLQSVEHEQRQVAVQRVVLQPVVHQEPAAAHARQFPTGGGVAGGGVAGSRGGGVAGSRGEAARL